MKWIKCSDALPKFTKVLKSPHTTLRESDPVLGVEPDNRIAYVYLMQFDDEDKVWVRLTEEMDEVEITHWMPLPAPPEETENPCNFCGTPDRNNPSRRCIRSAICTNRP